MKKQDWINLWLLFKDIAKREKSTVITLFIYAITAGTGPFIGMVGMGFLVDSIYAGAGQEELFRSVLIILLGILLCSLLQSRATETLNQTKAYTKTLEAGPMNHKSLSMDYEYLEDTHVQELRSRAFSKSYYGIRGWYIVLLEHMLMRIVNVFATLIIVIPSLIAHTDSSANTEFPWSALLLIPAIVFLIWLDCKAGLHFTRKARALYNTRDSFYNKKRYYMDMLAGAESQKDLRILDQQKVINDDISQLCHKLQETELRESKLYVMRHIISAATSVILGLAIYLLVGKFASDGTISIGNVVTFTSSIIQMATAFERIAVGIGNFKQLALYAQDYLEYMNLPQRKYTGTIPVEKRRDNKFSVSFENVTFRYPGTDVDVIKNLTLQFEIGEKMAIVGKNGSGKSTFIKLLCRLYDVTEGCIKVNGIDIRMYDYREYCNLFAVVFQDFCMFAFPLGENIAGSDKYEEQEIISALQKVGLGERLAELPDGLNTYVGTDFSQNGVSFSGGEKQKMAIARAIYKNAPFVIMDEPTAALDPLAECEVYAGFDQMVGQKTALYISHRLASCRFCEDILVFDQGKVVQRGSHEQLKDQDGIYQELWNAQAQYYA